jgi:hypothetical protein
MNDPVLSLTLLPERLAVCRLASDAALPDWARRGQFSSITRTPDELSIICGEADVPEGVRCERGWRALKVTGPLDLGMVGVLAGLATPLAAAGVSLLAVGTFDTDYLLVKEERLEQAVAALVAQGHQVRRP